jgi:hypothetical protein
LQNINCLEWKLNVKPDMIMNETKTILAIFSFSVHSVRVRLIRFLFKSEILRYRDVKTF